MAVCEWVLKFGTKKGNRIQAHKEMCVYVYVIYNTAAASRK